MRKRPVAVLDACVLVPMPLADTLLRLAEPPALYEPRWTDEILAEVTRTLVVHFGKSRRKALYREKAMRDYFRSALVEGYEPFIGRMTNDAKDRHVLAAAAACRADYLITYNLRHFPARHSGAHDTIVLGPSAFLKLLVEADRATVEQRLREQAQAIGTSLDGILDRLEGAVPAFVAMLRPR